MSIITDNKSFNFWNNALEQGIVGAVTGGLIAVIFGVLSIFKKRKKANQSLKRTARTRMVLESEVPWRAAAWFRVRRQ